MIGTNLFSLSVLHFCMRKIKLDLGFEIIFQLLFTNCQITNCTYNLPQVKLVEGKRLQHHHAKRLINCVKHKSHYASKLL